MIHRPPARPFSTSAEAELLLCCARTSLDPDTSARVQTLLQEEIDWSRLLLQATRHAVVPLLFWHLSERFSDQVPPACMACLRDYFRDSAQRSVYLTWELGRILKLFEARGICALPFKGPVLAASAYGNPMLREFGDLDILVPKRDILQARDVLLAEGYRPYLRLTAAQEAAYLRSSSEYEYCCVRDEDRAVVDLHWRIRPKYFSVTLEPEPLWERRGTMCIGGRDFPTLSPEDSLLVLCVHGAKHLWQSLGWIADVAEQLRLSRELDWELLLKQTRALGIERMLFLGLYLARDLLAAPLPDGMAARLHADSVVKALAGEVRARLWREDECRSWDIGRYLFHLRVSERVGDRVTYFLRGALSPTEDDWSSLSLPACLAFLYPLLRLARLLRKQGRGLFRRPPAPLAPVEMSPPLLLQRMLALAEVGPSDVVYDLGCGDGRIVIEAAKRYGARGVGVELDPQQLAEAKARARQEGVEHLVEFRRQDARTLDLSAATVVTLFLLLSSNLKLRPLLEAQLRPGSRIVSRRFGMADWTPERTAVVPIEAGASDTLFLWRL